MTTLTSAASFSYIRDLIYRESGITLDDSKEYLVTARLDPLAKEEGYSNLDELVTALRSPSGRDLRAKVIDAMTTNETSFFRDAPHFELLKNKLIPELLERSPSGDISFWSAACSSGQESYSIAMTIAEHFPGIKSRVKILATDISAEMLDRTRAGIYSQTEINRGLPIQLLMKHFRQMGRQWRVSDDLRRMVTVKNYNMVKDAPPVAKSHFVFLRNVLIYFDLPAKQRILSRMRKVLGPDGYLFLGGAETTLNVDRTFKALRVGRAVCYQPE